MATYVYETIPSNPKVKPCRFEMQQKMSDPPLKVDPKTGLPVRRVIVGGSGARNAWCQHPVDERQAFAALAYIADLFPMEHRRNPTLLKVFLT